MREATICPVCGGDGIDPDAPKADDFASNGPPCAACNGVGLVDVRA